MGSLQWDFNYTYSKSLDVGSNAERINQFEAFGQFDQVINAWSRNQLRAVSDFDTTHQFNTNWVYELPFGRGKRFGAGSSRWLDALVGGWQWSGLARWTSGFPTTISTGCCFPTNWELYSSAILDGPKPATRFLPIRTAIPTYSRTPPPPRSRFVSPIQESRGNATSFAGPGYFGIDLA